MGLILSYKTSRFINFAYASMGSLAGVTAIGLHLEKDVPFFVALPIGVAIGVVTGAVVELIVRRFRHTSRLILTVASRSEEHTSELQSLMRSSYAVFCLKQKKNIAVTTL